MKFIIDPSLSDPPTYQMGQRGIKTIATSNSPSGRLSFRKQCCLPVCAICVFAVERCGMMRSVDSSPHHPTIPAVHLPARPQHRDSHCSDWHLCIPRVCMWLVKWHCRTALPYRHPTRHASMFARRTERCPSRARARARRRRCRAAIV